MCISHAGVDLMGQRGPPNKLAIAQFIPHRNNLLYGIIIQSSIEVRIEVHPSFACDL